MSYYSNSSKSRYSNSYGKKRYSNSYRGGGSSYSSSRGGGGAQQISIKTVDTLISNNTFGVVNNNSSSIVNVAVNLTMNGTSSYSRIGNMTKGKYGLLTGSIYPIEANNNYPGGFYRIIVYFYKGQTDTLPTFNDLFQGYDSSGKPIVNLQVGPNVSKKGTIDILLDRKYQLGFIYNNNGSLISTSPAQIVINEYIPLSSKTRSYVTQYDVTSGNNDGTIKAVSGGLMGVMIVGSNTPNTMQVQANFRYAYLDN
jgi:hypothetical protein